MPLRRVAEVEFGSPHRITPLRLLAALPPLAILAAVAAVLLTRDHSPPIATRVVLALPPRPAPAPPSLTAGGGLAAAPDPALLENGPSGPLPVIGRDGRAPWRVYARPFPAQDSRPRVAVLIAGLGLAGDETRNAIAALPPEVTLAFDPYGQDLDHSLAAARAAGHEVALVLPLEPSDYPRQDPGPETLLTSLAARDNLDRLDWVLSRAAGYVGVVNTMGDRFTASRPSLLPVLEDLAKRGLLFIDADPSGTSIVPPLARSMGLPLVSHPVALDVEPSGEIIDRRLLELEDAARRSGAALALGHPYPVTLERVAVWAKGLAAKGLVLAPASALAAAGAAPGTAP